MSKKTKRVQKNRITVQIKDDAAHARLVTMADTRGLCVATLMRVYTMEGLAADERIRGVRQ